MKKAVMWLILVAVIIFTGSYIITSCSDSGTVGTTVDIDTHNKKPVKKATNKTRRK